MSVRLGFVVALLVAPLAAMACSSSSTNVGVSYPDGGGTNPAPDDGGSTSEAASDAGVDAPSGTCEGACKTTSLVADFGGKMRTLTRAQFGTQPGDGGTELHTESHLGGSAACPSQSSPSPDYTLIVSAIPRGSAGKKLSDKNKVTSAFFDFKGDLGLAAPSGITEAISVNITVASEDPATPPAWVAVDVSASFREGTVKGHLYAEYCDSLTQ